MKQFDCPTERDHQLTLTEREVFFQMHHAGARVSAIVQAMGRSQSTIGRARTLIRKMDAWRTRRFVSGWKRAKMAVIHVRYCDCPLPQIPRDGR